MAYVCQFQKGKVHFCSSTGVQMSSQDIHSIFGPNLFVLYIKLSVLYRTFTLFPSYPVRVQSSGPSNVLQPTDVARFLQCPGHTARGFDTQGAALMPSTGLFYCYVVPPYDVGIVFCITRWNNHYLIFYLIFYYEKVRMAYGHPPSTSYGGLEGPFGPCWRPLVPS